MSISPLVVEGVVKLLVSDRQPADCICCPGPHVFGYGIELEDYEGRYPYHRHGMFGLDTDFLYCLFREGHEYALDGRRVRVTVELLPEVSNQDRDPASRGKVIPDLLKPGDLGEPSPATSSLAREEPRRLSSPGSDSGRSEPGAATSPASSPASEPDASKDGTDA